MDQETFAYFEEIKDLTLHGAEDAVRQRPFVDRLLVVTMRHELPPQDLEGMDLEGLLKHAIDAGWIGKQSIMGLGIGEITIAGDEATAVAITPGRTVRCGYAGSSTSPPSVVTTMRSPSSTPRLVAVSGCISA